MKDYYWAHTDIPGVVELHGFFNKPARYTSAIVRLALANAKARRQEYATEAEWRAIVEMFATGLAMFNAGPALERDRGWEVRK